MASLAAARDESSLERIKYDGPRLLIGVLLPVALLAGIYAGPFLSLWVGPHYAPYAPMLRLFLVATLPLMLSVHAQMAIGMGLAELVALPLLVGSLVNLPLSYFLTVRLGVSGVIWGTVLTTLFSNLLVPGVLLFRLLRVRLSGLPVPDAQRPPARGRAADRGHLGLPRALSSPDPSGTTLATRSLPLVIHLTLGTLAYLAGYLAAPVGRADLAALARVHRR